MDELKEKLMPCPFCGSDRVTIEDNSSEDEEDYIILCEGCGCAVLASNDAMPVTKEELMQKWNKRATTQEARAMSLDDIMEIYNTRESHIWPHDTAPYMFVEEHPDIHTYQGSWTAWREIMAILHDGIFIHTRNTYGKTWRCWTSRPTDEQREAVKWE